MTRRQAMPDSELTMAVLAGMDSVTYLPWWDKPVVVRRPAVLRTWEVKGVISGNGKGNARSESESGEVCGRGS